MHDLVIQPYGIHPWGDLLGFLILITLSGWLPVAVRKWFWIVAQTWSGWGSLTILPRATYRLDPVTFVYHFLWVVGNVWFVAKVWHPTWAESMAKWNAWLDRTGVRIGDWVFDNVTHRGHWDGEHERL